jgi:chromatin segregation and condensation protein Rec8/ScpA/Scc1 (kleisin family)
MNNEEKHEWDRLTGESSKAYGHFCLYRDAGKERSLRKLAADAKTPSKLRQLQHWSSRWKWVERCQKYDDHLEYQDRLQQEKERREMRKRHAKIAVLGQNIAVKGLEKLLARVQEDEKAVAPADLTRLFDTSVKVERLSRGEPTEIEKSEHTGSLDIEARYRAMTPEERRAEIVRIFSDELGMTQEEAEALADRTIGRKENDPLSKP